MSRNEGKGKEFKRRREPDVSTRLGKGEARFIHSFICHSLHQLFITLLRADALQAWGSQPWGPQCMRGEETDMEPVDSGATIYLSAQDTYTPLSSPHRRWGWLLSRTGLKDINKSKEKMRCEKKTESIIPSKLKVLGRGWQETGGRRWRLGWFPVDNQALEETQEGGLLSAASLPWDHLGRHTHNPTRLWRWRERSLALRTASHSPMVLLREDTELATIIQKDAWLRVAVISLIKPFSYWIRNLGYQQPSSPITLRIQAHMALTLGLMWKAYLEGEGFENWGVCVCVCVSV